MTIFTDSMRAPEPAITKVKLFDPKTKAEPIAQWESFCKLAFDS